MKNSKSDNSQNYKLSKASLPISNQEIRTEVEENLTHFYQQSKKIHQSDIEQAFRFFLTNDTNNTINLEKFHYADYCNGTGEAITEFVARNNKRRLRVSKIDFILSKIVGKAYGLDIVPLEDGEIEKNDAIVLSFPFSGNGTYYPNYEHVLDQADELMVPVLIDGAYFGIANGITYPLNHKCVTDFTVSLSKSHSVTEYRIGMRFRKEHADDMISSANAVGVFNKFSASMGIFLLEKFSHNSIIQKYHSQQKKICSDLKLDITKTLTFGLGKTDIWTDYKRGNNARLCISENFVG